MEVQHWLSAPCVVKHVWFSIFASFSPSHWWGPEERDYCSTTDTVWTQSLTDHLYSVWKDLSFFFVRSMSPLSFIPSALPIAYTRTSQCSARRWTFRFCLIFRLRYEFLHHIQQIMTKSLQWLEGDYPSVSICKLHSFLSALAVQVQLINDAYNLVIDAILGPEIDLKDVKEPYSGILLTLKQVKIPIASVDVPSGSFSLQIFSA